MSRSKAECGHIVKSTLYDDINSVGLAAGISMATDEARLVKANIQIGIGDDQIAELRKKGLSLDELRSNGFIGTLANSPSLLVSKVLEAAGDYKEAAITKG